jgi:antagonist of KipI
VTVPRLRDAGDSMLLLEWEPVVDVAVNARAVATAAALRARGVAGVRDVRATYRSLAVDYDPLASDRDAIANAMEDALAAGLALPRGRDVEIPVAYGGSDGPDLAEVAERSGMTAAAVVDAHASPSYHAFMLGFMPGFAYLGPVTEAIVAPRRATPRLRVAAGSVGIAGRQTGIYPRESPGGWAIVGRTNVVLFDPVRTPPALVQPGDRVQFVPVERLDPVPPVVPPKGTDNLLAVTVIRPGLLTTVQDTGRWGHQSLGVPVGGALDATALRAANAAVDNRPDAAALEVTLAGCELRFDRACAAAVSGADLGVELDGRPMPLDTPVRCAEGAHLRFTERRAGARAYLAFRGGVDVPAVLGSRSTDLNAGFGGFGGRALRAGDRLGTIAEDDRVAAEPVKSAVGSRPTQVPPRLRVLPGPHEDWFDADALAVLERTRFTVTPQSNRIGYRLASPVALSRSRDGEMISDATVAGGIQVPPDGQPILLMADRQVTGGYPILATVITADLPLAAQLAPGDGVTFAVCSRSAALAALHQARSR